MYLFALDAPMENRKSYSNFHHKQITFCEQRGEDLKDKQWHFVALAAFYRKLNRVHSKKKSPAADLNCILILVGKQAIKCSVWYRMRFYTKQEFCLSLLLGMAFPVLFQKSKSVQLFIFRCVSAWKLFWPSGLPICVSLVWTLKISYI